jgi:hypothetical protein
MTIPYRTVPQIDAEITALANDFPTTCRRFTFSGRQTHEGRTVAYLKIGTAEGENRPRVLITTGMHGRELAPPDAMLNYLRKLLTAYRDDRPISIPAFTDPVGPVTYPSTELSIGDTRRIIDKLDVFVVPLVNPDGRNHDITLHPLENADGTFNPAIGAGGWRMNRRPAPAGSDPANQLCTGVDLNRNFDIAWNVEQYYTNPTHNVDLSTAPCQADNYRGPSAGSEPETQNLMELAETQAIQFSIDIHSAAGAIFYPWGIEDTQSDDQFKTFDNPLWNHDPANPDEHPGRDGAGNPGYAEFFPDSAPMRLRTQHRIIADFMRDAVLAAAGSNEQARTASRYETSHSAANFGGEPENFPGSMMDWIFARQIRGGAGVPDPIFSLGMEITRPPESHEPNTSLMRPDPVTEYPKAEREIVIAAHAYLKYIAAWWPPRTSSSTCPCFIATAAFGSPYHPHVTFLRHLRDNIFPATPFGLQFIRTLNRFYYSFSPPVAAYLNDHETARRLTRIGFLRPLVVLLRLAQKLAMRFRQREAQVGVLVCAVTAILLAVVFAAGGFIALVVKLLMSQ